MSPTAISASPTPDWWKTGDNDKDGSLEGQSLVGVDLDTSKSVGSCPSK